MVEVFKTNVQEVDHSDRMVRQLLEHFPESRINFDLEDCDKVLRVEGEDICPLKIVELLKLHGYDCFALE